MKSKMENSEQKSVVVVVGCGSDAGPSDPVVDPRAARCLEVV